MALILAYDSITSKALQNSFNVQKHHEAHPDTDTAF